MKIGVDIVDIARIEQTIEQKGDRFLNRVFTEQELTYCYSKGKPCIHLAGRFAAKEAFIKAYGKGISLKSIEILNQNSGRPQIFLRRKNKKAMKTIDVSISHTHTLAIAAVVVN